MVGHQIRLRAMTIFRPGRIKRTRNLLFAYVGAHISCKMMHMTQSGLETNSSGDVVWGKEIAPLPQGICWLKKIWSNFFFCICGHLGDSSKHLRRPKVKRHDEESSPNDALTPKKGKTRVAGKVRRYLWVCPLTPHTPPPPSPHLPSPCLCKMKMHGSSKMAWIDAIRTARYPLILMLRRDVFMFVVKQGVPSDEDLEWPYPSCLSYGKDFFRAFRSIAN